MLTPLPVRGLVNPNSPTPGRETVHPLTKEAASRTRRRLLRWGRHHFVPYPWRSEQDPWLSFVAEFLLQRTRASQVAPVFNAIKHHYPTADLFVRNSESATIAITARLGLHRRGPFLTYAAKAILARGGSPPSTMEELCSLPGVGMYTAAAWLSLHRGQRAIIIDANVSRWLSRMTGLPYNRDPRHIRWVQTLADELTPKHVFRDYNYAVLDFTMKVCTSRIPSCEACPLRSDCQYHREVTR